MDQNQRDLIELDELLAELQRRKKYSKFEYAFPADGDYPRSKYPHAMKFFEAGMKHRDRCVIAANRVGKSFMAGYEMACHLTGRYPDWWKGRRFREPITAWAAGITNETTRTVIQKILFGNFLDPGTGLIPQADLAKIANKVNCPGAIGTAYVRHYTDGIYDGDSVIDLKTYDQGPDKFQGTEVHVIWLDEEPKDYKIWDECLLRTMKTSDFPGGILMLTFTPLFGLSKVVLNFLPFGRHPINNVNPTNDSWSIRIEWDDIPHLTAEEKAEMMKKIPPWQREARTKGLVPIGSGLIYPVPEQNICVIPFQIPDYWRRAYGLDVGFINKTAGVWAAQDPADNVWYIYSELYMEQQPAPLIAHEVKQKCKGLRLPGVIDPASRRTSHDGSRLLEQYWDLDLDLVLADHSLETGLPRVWELLASGQLKVFSTCTHWFDEFRTYHKDDKGKIPELQDDDLMDATRYLVMTGFDIARSVTEFYQDDETDENDQSDRWGLRRFY